jgi:DNA-binding CsgD family transcriptional regulator/tetratricopeptide (TPR) repeat protein
VTLPRSVAILDGVWRRPRRAPFVGREAELAEIDALWQEVCAGQAAEITISGEAGIGKTRLVTELMGRTEAAVVLCGMCVPISSGGLPYGPVLEALRRLLQDRGVATLAELLGPGYADLDELLRIDDSQLPGGGAGGPGQRNRGRLYEGFLALLSGLAEEAPVLLVIEDIHWAEQSTLDLLMFLSTTLRRERVLVVLTYRDEQLAAGPLSPALLELFRRPTMTHLSLAPFDLPELTALLQPLAASPLPADAVRRIADRSGGNAFFAQELLDAQPIEAADSLPAHVRDVVLLRLATLSPQAQQVVRWAAAAGRRMSHALLSAVSELPEPELLEALRELVRSHVLIGQHDGSYRFRHALTQEAVYSDLLPGERRARHAGVATALSASPELGDDQPSAVTALIAHHWEAAGDHEKALVAAIAAGRAAVDIQGFSEGLQHFRRALAMWRDATSAEQAGTDRPELLAAAARCAYQADQGAEAVQLVEQALQELPADQAVRRALLHEALGSYLSRTDATRALGALREAYRLLERTDRISERARVTAALAQALSTRGRYADSAPFWEETLDLARQSGSRREEVLGLRTSGWHLAMHGEPDTGINRMREALQIALLDGDIEGVSVSYNHLCLALDFVGRTADSIALATEALAWESAQTTLYTPMIDMLDSIVLVLFRLGRWEQAEQLADRLYSSHGARRALMATAVRAELAAARGDQDRAEQELTVAKTMLDGDDDPLNHGVVHAAAATRAMWREDHGTARAELGRGLEIVGSRGDDQQFVALGALGLRIEADEAERLRARRLPVSEGGVLDTGTQLQERVQHVWQAMGHRQQSFPEAALEVATADAELERLMATGSAAHWGRIADGWDRLGRPYPAAYARWREAELLIVERDPHAPGAVQRAHAAAAALGATALDREIVALARRVRVDLDAARAVPPPPPRANPFNLTDRELQVLRLLTRGLRNREIGEELYMSTSTASVHVSNILSKLGAKNRVEAAAIAHRLHLDSMITG